MRLITHNMLKCNVKGVERGYPLAIEAETMEVIESDFSADLIKNVLRKIDYSTLRAAGSSLGVNTLDDYENVTEELSESEDFLRKVHHLLFELHVQEGTLVCPESSRRFPIKDGIPNMLLHEDEV
jgi:multifunctional methyltransferase subunit TRM112